MTIYRRLLTQHADYRNLWLAGLVSQAGDWFNTIATVVLVNRYAGTLAAGLALSALFVARNIPPFLISPIAGIVADRFNRKAVMIASDVARAITVLGLLLVNSPGEVWLLYTLLVLQFSASAFFEPAKQAMLPNLLTTQDEVVAANTLASASWSAMLTLGAAIGGLVTGLFGVEIAIIIDAATFLLSAGFILRIRASGQPSISSSTTPHTAGLGDYVIGLRYVARKPTLRLVTFVKGMAQFGSVDVMLAVFAAQVFVIGEDGAVALGWMYAMVGIGAVAGPLLADRLSKRRPALLWRWIGLSFLFMPLGWLIFGSGPWFAVALVGLFLRGVGGSIGWTYSTAIIQLEAEDAYRGRVFAFDFANFTLLSTLSVIMTGLLLDWLNLPPRTAALLISSFGLLPLLLWTIFRQWVARQPVLPTPAASD